MELGDEDSMSDAFELEEVSPPDRAFFSNPHGEETNEDTRVSSSARAPTGATPAVAEDPDVEARPEGVLLAEAAESPESLAEALAHLLGAVPALALVRGALDHLASSLGSGPTAPPPALPVAPARPALAEHRNDGPIDARPPSPPVEPASPAPSQHRSDRAEDKEDDVNLIKSKTMHNMVETVNDGQCQLLFLTNPQATQIAKSEDGGGVRLMLEKLGVRGGTQKPQLVIEMLPSGGFQSFCRSMQISKVERAAEYAGIDDERAPFLSKQDEFTAEAKIDRFMLEVIIPLAAQTNAVVFCEAIPTYCVLAASFFRMYAIAKAKYGGKTPFTVISSTDNILELYKSKSTAEDEGLQNQEPYWKILRDQSRAWQKQNAALETMAREEEEKEKKKHGGAVPPPLHDLDPNAACILIPDNIDPKTHREDENPGNALLAATIRHLSSSVPSLVLTTGTSEKVTLDVSEKAALNMLVARVESGAAVLALDVRPREDIALPLSEDTMNLQREQQGDPRRSYGVKKNGHSRLNVTEHHGRFAIGIPEQASLKRLTVRTRSRAGLIDAGKEQISELCDSLLQKTPPQANTFDVCMLAFLHDVLTGDGDSTTIELFGQLRTDAHITLWKAIEKAQADSSELDDDGGIPPATPQQIVETATWLSNRIFSDAWQVLDDRAEREAKDPPETYETLYEKLIYAHSTFSHLLLSSPNFHHLNLKNDSAEATRMVKKLVRLDRLPQQNRLEGLLLLQDAWRAYDVSMHLADRYKLACKTIFALQLVFSWLVVVGSGLDSDLIGEWEDSILHAVFGVSVAFSILVSLDGMLNPKARWRQLRSGAGSLQSIIWKYRTRTRPFALDDSQPESTRPETTLCSMLNEWRDNLIAGAGLKTTNLFRKYPKRVYRHYQNNPENNKGDGLLPESAKDDFHSPMRAEADEKDSDYIKLRIKPMIAFYEERIPVYTRHAMFLRVTILMLGVTASVLAHYNLLTWVTVATAAATVTTSWDKFGDAEHKVERYSSAIAALRNLLAHWNSHNPVQKATKDSITNLVITAEAIICEEQVSWNSTAAKQETEKGAQNEEKDGEKKASGLRV